MFDEYSLRELVLDQNKNFIEKWVSEAREGVFESVFLTHINVGNNIQILNSRIKEENKTKYIQLEISIIHPNNDDHLDQWFLKNQTLFKKELEIYRNSTLKVDAFSNPYSMISDHSGKSLIMTLNKVFSFSLDWNEETKNYQFFDCFKYKDNFISLIANNKDNTVAFVYIREKDTIYTVKREINRTDNVVKESYSKILTSPFWTVVDKSKIKSMRIETIQRGAVEDLIVLIVLDSGLFVSFDLIAI